MKPNEEEQNEATSTVDDVFVPGIGVRAALDDDEPATSNLLQDAGERCRRAAGRMRVRASQRIGRMCSAGSRLAAGLKTAGAGIRTAVTPRRRSLGDVTEPVRRNLERARRSVRSAGESSAARLRMATSLAARDVRRWRGRAGMLRLTMPRFPAAPGRSLHGVESRLIRIMDETRKTVRAAARYKPHFRVIARYAVDATKLRRAVPALAVLLAMVLFVIQEMVTAIRR